jgi:uncharacterized protein with von Willebrand factor type A (vWA) domain
VLQRTLREVEHCAGEQVAINIYMLECVPHLTEFVEQIATISHGRVFHTTPDRLADDLVASLDGLGLDGAAPL